MHYPISSGASIISDYWRSGSHFESGYSNVTRSHRMHTRDTWTPQAVSSNQTRVMNPREETSFVNT